MKDHEIKDPLLITGQSLYQKAMTTNKIKCELVGFHCDHDADTYWLENPPVGDFSYYIYGTVDGNYRILREPSKVTICLTLNPLGIFKRKPLRLKLFPEQYDAIKRRRDNDS